MKIISRLRSIYAEINDTKLIEKKTLTKRSMLHHILGDKGVYLNT